MLGLRKMMMIAVIVEARYFDVLMMPKDQVLLKFYSRQESKKIKIYDQVDL